MAGRRISREIGWSGWPGGVFLEKKAGLDGLGAYFSRKRLVSQVSQACVSQVSQPERIARKDSLNRTTRKDSQKGQSERTATKGQPDRIARKDSQNGYPEKDCQKGLPKRIAGKDS